MSIHHTCISHNQSTEIHNSSQNDFMQATVEPHDNTPVWINHVEDGFKLGISLALFHHRKIVAESSETRLKCLMVKTAGSVFVEMSTLKQIIENIVKNVQHACKNAERNTNYFHIWLNTHKQCHFSHSKLHYNKTEKTHLNIMLNSRSESSDTPLWLLHKK